ncbi:hypothetical protein CEXT_231271 [Caerostris extrusa]|uniref:Uncharacterized protein n=1 Tax=Caerostris extrusa TaxID=172846 RepID=A0AAV4RBV6_CAEEX|nr:hypothetical protein CEXT_231271 [Caerostris extrusa]
MQIEKVYGTRPIQIPVQSYVERSAKEKTRKKRDKGMNTGTADSGGTLASILLFIPACFCLSVIEVCRGFLVSNTVVYVLSLLSQNTRLHHLQNEMQGVEDHQLKKKKGTDEINQSTQERYESLMATRFL